MRSRIIHPLPTAQNFVGREGEIGRLQQALLGAGGDVRTVSLVGIGGAGKTALAGEFLRRLPAHPQRPDLLFVWSFYMDQDPAAFLAAAHDFVAEEAGDGKVEIGRGPGVLSALTDALEHSKQRVLFVLDGLERVQVARDHHRREYGSLEDALLRRALIRLTSGVGQARVLITTRFPASDLTRWNQSGHSQLDIVQLDRTAGRDLLRRRGVRAPADDPSPLDRLIDEFGSHALTLDHLGGYLASFRAGDPASPPPATQAAETRPDDVPVPVDAAQQLIRVLAAYAKELPPTELALLQRLCLYRFGATADRLFTTFARHKSRKLAGPLYSIERTDFDAALAALIARNLVFAEGDGSFGTHPAVRDFFYAMFANPAAFHAAIAGTLGKPQADEAWYRISSYLGQYAAVRDGPDDYVRECGQDLVDCVRRVRRHIGEDAHAVFERFAREVAAGARPDPPRVPNLVVTLSGKPGEAYPHDKATLDLIEELIYHSLQAGDRKAADHLYRRRLGGRDHLGKVLGEFARGERIVAALTATPQELSAMDTGVERAFGHTSNDLPDEALMLDRGWYLRGLGDLPRSHHHFRAARPLWAGTVLVLMGYLADVARGLHAWTQTRDIAQLLMGARSGGYRPIWVGWGEALTDAEIALLHDRRPEAQKLARPWLENSTLSAEVTRSQLAMAEVCRRNGDVAAAERFIAKAEPWIQRSGSIEHLIVMLMSRMRVAEDQRRHTTADGYYTEALLMARQCGFALYHIDLLNLRCDALLARDERKHAAEAKVLALAALHGVTFKDQSPAAKADLPMDELLIHGALHPRCHYAWGEAAAKVTLGRCALIEGATAQAVELLAEACAIYDRLQAPQLARTNQLLADARRGKRRWF